MRDVLITGMGVISPIGITLEAVASTLANARSGIRIFEASPLTKPFPAGVVPYTFTDRFTKLELPYLDRCQQMAIIAARQAIADAGVDDFSVYGQRAGVFYGTAKGGAETEQAWHHQLLVDSKQSARPFSGMAIMHNGGAAQISIRHQILGPVMTHSSACTSSGTAIGDAARAIRDGYLDIAVAGGAEAPLTASLFGIFDGMRALAPVDPLEVGRSCKPFSKTRSGLVLGEGAAFVVLESAENARKRDAACYAAVTGYGVASDAYHIGQPNANGQTAAMRAALADAGLEASDIGYFNTRATATRGGDEVEARAIRTAFGEAAETMPVSSTKSVHGHLLGAASVLELVVTVIAMTESFLPATAHIDDIDAECALNHVVNEPVFDRPIERAISFSCGFGGTNVALVVSKHWEMPMRRHIISASSTTN